MKECVILINAAIHAGDPLYLELHLFLAVHVSARLLIVVSRIAKFILHLPRVLEIFTTINVNRRHTGYF